MKLAVLGSGSGGNATVFENGGRYFMVDAGLSSRQLVKRMEFLGVNPEKLEGILLTHEHGDHIQGLTVFARKHAVPVYTTALTQEAIREKVPAVSQWKLFAAGQEFEVAGVEVTSFSIPHDAVDPVGFVFESSGQKAGVLTDLGYVTPVVQEKLAGVRALFLEANYCEQMLEADPNRPWSLKQRISSRHGHLSNEQARDLVRELMPGGLERVVLGHLSRDCNRGEVVEGVFSGLELKDLVVARQCEPTRWVRLADIPRVIGKGGQLEFGDFALAG
ncbi:MAG: MBL fold metallo-hydrolase [Verrucomicrobiota bacterium]